MGGVRGDPLLSSTQVVRPPSADSLSLLTLRGPHRSLVQGISLELLDHQCEAYLEAAGICSVPARRHRSSPPQRHRVQAQAV